MSKREMVALSALAAAGVVAVVSAPAAAFPDYLEAWQNRYPTSTIPTRMGEQLGFSCFTCHSTPFGDVGTCYREDIRHLVNMGVEIDAALAQLEPVDSDGDGVSNIQEILAPRIDLPGHIGYHAGLIGLDGRSPCSSNPDTPTTMQRETPCRADWNFNGAVNSSDISEYLTAWLDSVQNGNLNADVSGDGAVNSSDISEFLTRWLAAIQSGSC
jgi:hypothetical protein